MYLVDGVGADPIFWLKCAAYVLTAGSRADGVMQAVQRIALRFPGGNRPDAPGQVLATELEARLIALAPDGHNEE